MAGCCKVDAARLLALTTPVQREEAQQVHELKGATVRVCSPKVEGRAHM